MVLLAPNASADWLQLGGDAAHTGAAPFAGPKTDETAFRVQLPGSGTHSAIVIGRDAYVLTRSDRNETLPADAVFRIGLDDGAVEEVLSFDEPRAYFSSDGERLFVVSLNDLEAFSLSARTLAWTYPLPRLLPQRTDTYCEFPAVSGGTVYLTCSERFQPVPHDDVNPGAGDQSIMFTAAVNATTGTQRWLWVRDETQQAAGELVRLDDLNRTARYNFRSTLSIQEPYVYVYTVDSYGGIGTSVALQYTLWSLEGETGNVRWRRNDTAERYVLTPRAWGAHPTANANAAFIRLDQVQALSPTRGATLLEAGGEPIWSAEVGRADSRTGRGSTGFGLSGDVLLATSPQTLYRFDALTGALRWQYTIPQPDTSLFSVFPVIITDGVAYATLWNGPNGDGTLIAFDLETGVPLWEHALISRFRHPNLTPYGPAMAEGAFVASFWDGSVEVIGETGASLKVRAEAGTAYPQPDTPFTVDLSATTPGAFGAASSFRAQLPNGTWIPWQEDPRLRIVLDTAGDQTVRFQARNEANQTASGYRVFDVGATQPNVLSRMFAPENQDLTFGVLGILIAVGGGIFGIVRLQGRRSRYLRELRAIEEAHGRNRLFPRRLEEALHERRSHVQGMHLDGKLDEGQLTILEKRIDELARQSRLQEVGAQFDSLPHGMVRRLQGMLEDGRVTGWEREHLLDALKADKLLTPEQKRKIGRLVEEWFRRDSTSARRHGD